MCPELCVNKWKWFRPNVIIIVLFLLLFIWKHSIFWEFFILIFFLLGKNFVKLAWGFSDIFGIIRGVVTISISSNWSSTSNGWDCRGRQWMGRGWSMNFWNFRRRFRLPISIGSATSRSWFFFLGIAGLFFTTTFAMGK